MSRRSETRPPAVTGYTAVQGAALLIAVVFLIIGVLGFVPGATAGYDHLQWAGHHSGAKLFGMFAVSGLHNALHLVFGLAGLWLARTYAAARTYLIVGGLIYLGLWIYGLLVHGSGAANVIPLNNADNWLHLGLGAAMTIFGITLGGRRDPTKPQSVES